MTLRFFAAALTDAEDLNQRLGEIKAAQQLPDSRRKLTKSPSISCTDLQPVQTK
jgi:hypothetical protein